MNIRDHQAKEVLDGVGPPVATGGADDKITEMQAAGIRVSPSPVKPGKRWSNCLADIVCHFRYHNLRPA